MEGKMGKLELHWTQRNTSNFGGDQNLHFEAGSSVLNSTLNRGAGVSGTHQVSLPSAVESMVEPL